MVPEAQAAENECSLMRICLIVSSDVTTDSRVMRHARTLGRRGHDVIVLGPKSKETVSEEETEYFRIVRVELRVRERLQRFANGIKSRHARIRETMRGPTAIGPASPVSLLRRLFRRFSDIAILVSHLLDMNITIAKACRGLDADVYTSNNLDVLLAGAIASSGGEKKYLVYDAHELWTDMSVQMPLRAFFYNLEKALIRRADAVMTVNEFIALELARRYHIRTPEVVHNCAERSKIPLNAKHSTKVIALYHGVFSSDRGLENLIASSEYLEEDVLLLMRGSGEIKTKLKGLASSRGNCQFADPVPPDEVVLRAAEADVGIVPYLPTNLNNYFSSPNKLFEYIQAGIPVVASNLPFLSKIIHEEDIGLTFDPYDPRDIASTINTVTREHELKRLRQNVRRAAEKWCWESEEKKLLHIYERLREC